VCSAYDTVSVYGAILRGIEPLIGTGVATDFIDNYSMHMYGEHVHRRVYTLT
jgi:hypothetical protein